MATSTSWETAPCGFLGGMPLAMLAGLGEQTIVQALGLWPRGASRSCWSAREIRTQGEYSGSRRTLVWQPATVTPEQVGHGP